MKTKSADLRPEFRDLSWLGRLDCSGAGTLTSAWWFWPQAGILQVAVKHQELAGEHPLVGPYLTLDLQDVEFAIDRDPKAHAFFLDLACWLLTKCAAACREGADA